MGEAECKPTRLGHIESQLYRTVKGILRLLADLHPMLADSGHERSRTIEGEEQRVAALEHAVARGIAQALSTTHGAAPMSLRDAHLQAGRGAALAGAGVGAEAAVAPLSVAQGVEVYLLGPLQIGHVARLLPQLHGQQIAVHDGAGLGPRVIAAEPVVIGKVFRHAILGIEAEARGGLVHQPALARNGCIAHQATQGRQRGMGLRLDSQQVDAEETLDEFVNHGA